MTIHVTNAGPSVHGFTPGDALMQQEHPGAMEHVPAGVPHFPNSITLQPAKTRRLTWRFGDAGTLEFACHRPGPCQRGMRREITVT